MKKQPKGVLLSDLTTVKKTLDQHYDDLVTTTHDSLQMQDMTKAVKVIESALMAQDRIMVFGDFDADGITSTVILVDALRRLGGEVSYRMPDRVRDSHGLKKHHVDDVLAAGAKLLITVDGGINDRDSIAYATDQGLEVIVTDHHQSDLSRFPETAVAVLNPHQPKCSYPDKNLSGAGVVFKLVQALTDEAFCQKYLDVVAIGLVADCMRLTGEVRYLVRAGLEQLKKTEWVGLAQLLQALRIAPENINEDTIGFYLGPVINAASRLGEVGPAVQLFLDPAQATSHVEYLLHLNEQRKDWSRRATDSARSQIDAGKAYQLITTTEWPVGVLGLVAGQIAEKQQQPVIVMRQDGDFYQASCRAPVTADIESALRAKSDLFVHVGGHPAAAGFKLPAANLDALRKHLDTHYADQAFTARKPTVWDLDPKVLELELVELIESYAPFGQGVPAPEWCLQGVVIADLHWMGAQKNHLRLMLQAGSQKFSAVCFHAAEAYSHLGTGEIVDAHFTLRRHSWQGQARLQLMITSIN